MKKLFLPIFLVFSCNLLLAQWNQTGGNYDNYTTGRVSIGTTLFSDRLSIEGTGEWHIRLKDKGTGGIDWRIGSTGSAWAAGSGKFLISNSLSSPSAAFAIDQTNRVGIGTTSPQKILHVSGAGDVEQWIEATDDGFASLTLKSNNKKWHWSKRPGASQDALQLFFHDGTAWSVPYMSVSAGGNLGIGTSTPKSKLHVFDGGYRDYYVNRNIAGNTEDNQGINYILLHKAYVSTLMNEMYVMGKISAIRGGTNAWNRKISFEVNTATAYNTNRGSIISYSEPVRLVYVTYNGERYVAVEVAGESMLYGISFTGYAYNEALQIVYDQNVSNVADFASLDKVIIQAAAVGIGTKSPDAKLTVKGNIHAEEVKVDLSVPAPDYVFQKNYDLRTLAEVEDYINQNKHLPEVPAAKEMEANGVKLGEMNMLLLKKVEELTLYVIELKKENEREQKKIDDQQKKIELLESRLK